MVEILYIAEGLYKVAIVFFGTCVNWRCPFTPSRAWTGPFGPLKTQTNTHMHTIHHSSSLNKRPRQLFKLLKKKRNQQNNSDKCDVFQRKITINANYVSITTPGDESVDITIDFT